MRPLEAAFAGTAPRLLAGWEAITRVLADDEPHDRAELHAVTIGYGNLARHTVENLLGDAVRLGLVVAEGRGLARTWRRT